MFHQERDEAWLVRFCHNSTQPALTADYNESYPHQIRHMSIAHFFINWRNESSSVETKSKHVTLSLHFNWDRNWSCRNFRKLFSGLFSIKLTQLHFEIWRRQAWQLLLGLQSEESLRLVPVWSFYRADLNLCKGRGPGRRLSPARH